MLLWLLYGEYTLLAAFALGDMNSLQAKAKRAIGDALSLMPSDIELLASATGFYLYHMNDPETALTYADKLVQATAAAKTRRLYGIGIRIRVLKQLEDWVEVERSMSEILDIVQKENVPKYAVPDDFVKTIPEGAIDAKILAEYMKYVGDEGAPELPPKK